MEWAIVRDDKLIYMYYPFDPLYNCFVGHHDSPGAAMAALDEAEKKGLTQFSTRGDENH